MKKLILLLLSSIYLFAVTPFSLENVKELNVKVLNKKEIISKELETRIEKKIEEELKKLGIKTQTEDYINFTITINIDKIKDIDFVRTAISISEDVTALRDKELVKMAITYKKGDSFKAENIEEDIYESIVEYLFEDFEEQYKEENE